MNDADAPLRRPRAFRLDAGAEIEPQPDAYAREAAAASLSSDEVAIERAQAAGLAPARWRGLLSWGGLFWSAAGGLVSLALGLWAANLAEQSFQRFAALGWVAVALAGAAVLALLALALREGLAMLRLRRIAKLHQAAAAAHAADDRDAARVAARELVALYAGRTELARARAHVEALTHEIVDGRDLIDIAERDLVAPLDARAQAAVADAARRVSLVTAISPRALIDVLFVAAQAVRLVRRVSEIYGGRPGVLGFMRLARSVGAHLAVTGGVAVGDSLLQQVVGHGLAARLSARLGEGVLNGLLTARVGLSAIAVCRPLPFVAGDPPGIKDVAPFLFRGAP